MCVRARATAERKSLENLKIIKEQEEENYNHVTKNDNEERKNALFCCAREENIRQTTVFVWRLKRV